MAKYELQDLLYLMDRLRDPETGCPWDLKQDFASIVPHTLEEAYEVADTIERQDWAHLKDELGDLLFQVVFYARLGKEQDDFEFSDVIDNLVAKLIRRHPHVFPEGTLASNRKDSSVSEEQIKQNWELIKQQEREGKEQQRILDDIPAALPALTRAAKLQKRAAQVGFDWPEAIQVLDKIEEEIAELREAIAIGNEEHVRDEMGDILFAQVNLARHLGLSPETALRSTNQKFERRFGYVEQQVESSDREWQQFTLDELDQFWDQAKNKGL